jgi:hypothetical protein
MIAPYLAAVVAFMKAVRPFSDLFSDKTARPMVGIVASTTSQRAINIIVVVIRFI